MINVADVVVGGHVYLNQDIYEGANDHSPAGYYGFRGDMLEVVGIYNKSLSVRHKGREGSFSVYLNEVYLNSPLITVKEQREYIKKYGCERGGLGSFTELLVK